MGIVVAAYCLIYAQSRVFDFGGNSQLEALTQAATNVAVIPQSVSVPERVGVFGYSAKFGMFHPLRCRHRLRRHSEGIEDRILQQFGAYHRAHRTRPLRVQFTTEKTE